MHRKLGTIAILILIGLSAAVPSVARAKWDLAYWREMGAFECGGGLYMRIWTMRDDGVMMPGVQILDQTGFQRAVTDQNGRVDIGFDTVSEPIQLRVTDQKGRESDITPPMTRWHYPDYGRHSYEMLFVLKDDNAPGGFDTSLYGTLNQTGETSTDAPCTRSLSYYSTDPLNAGSDQFATTTWADSHGQTFVADGDRVRAVLLHGAVGGASNLTFTVDILQSGPDGQAIASATTANHSSIDPWIVGFGENQCPVTPGGTYYVRMTRSSGLSAYAMLSSNYPNGTYYVNGLSIPAQDIKGLVCCEKVTPATTGTISGTVRDPNGQPIQGALVRVEANSRRATSTSTGTYSIAGLLPGAYTLSAFKQGCTSQKTGSLTVQAGETATADLRLHPLSPNLVQNSGFETGQLAPWIKYRSFDGVSGTGYLNVPSHSGSYWAGRAVQNASGFGGACQVVDVVPGVEYTASCFLYTDSYVPLRLYEYPSNCQGRIGLDPSGSTSSSSSSIIWGPLAYSQTAWTPLSISALATGPKMTVFAGFWQTTTRDYNVVAFDDFHLGSTNLSGRLASAAGMPDGTRVSMSGQVVTASTGEIDGAFYAEESDRTRGIRVDTMETVDRGQVVSVGGVICTVDGERRIVADRVTVSGTAAVPRPLGLRPGAIVAHCLDSTGLLVRTWGIVTEAGADYVVLSDGGGAIKVYTSGGAQPGQFVSATGVVGAETGGGERVSVIRCRTAADLVPRS